MSSKIPRDKAEGLIGLSTDGGHAFDPFGDCSSFLYGIFHGVDVRGEATAREA